MKINGKFTKKEDKERYSEIFFRNLLENAIDKIDHSHPRESINVANREGKQSEVNYGEWNGVH